MDNPRKKLYSSLIASSDPDVKEHFSQWSEDEFDKKLSEDKKFQKDLFLDLKDIGLAKDEATFTKDYLSQPAPPAAPAGKPAATAKETPSTYGGFDITNFGPIGAIKKGVSGLVSAAKQMVGLKSEDAKYEEAQKKSQAGSVSGFAGADELGRIGRYETAASEFREKQKQKAEAEKPIVSGSKSTYLESPIYTPSKGLSPEDKKAYEKSRQEYQKLFSEAAPVFKKQAQAAAQKAKSDPSAYKKDKYGKTVPDPMWVAKEARDIASKAGAPAGGYAENFLQSNIESALMYEQKSPEFIAEADRISLKKYGKKMSDLYSEDVFKNVEPAQVYQDRLNAAAKKVKQTISAEYDPKFNAVNGEYEKAIANYKSSVANDPSIRQAVDEYDAKSIAELQKGVDSGTLSPEEANAMLTSKDSVKARNAYINGVVDQKYGPQLKTAYNKYLTDVNVLNNRRNARLRRQSDELEDYYNSQYKNQIDIAKKTYKISPERAKLLEDIQKQAYNNVMGREMQDKRRYDMNASVWENFVSSSLKGLGEGIQSTAFTLGMEDVASFGNLLAKNFETSDLNINSWSDVGFGREGLTKFATSAGNILGRMSPGLAASAAVAMATGGFGLGTLPSMLLAGVPSAAFETADIMGSIEQQMLSQSDGDIAKAQQAGSRALESQLKVWPTYLLDGLPFFPKLLKFAGKSKYAGLNVLTRGLAGGGINLVTETAQEVPQNVFEEIILADKDPTFSELYKNTTAEKIANTSASVVSMSLLMGSAPQVIDSSKDAIAKRAAAGYFAKQVLNEASHPGLMVENQSQFLTQLADQKNPRFAAQMVNILFQKGNIDKARAEVLAKKLDNYQRFKETDLGKSENPIVRQAGFILFDRYTEARNSKNKEAEGASLAALQDYASTGNAELVMLKLPDGSYNVYTYDDLNSLMADEDFQKASRESSEKYGALFEITPLVQTQEGLQNPKLQEVLQRFENIQAPAEKAETVVDEVVETAKPQPIDDEKILEGQKRAGVEAPKLFDVIPVEAAAVVDAVRSGEEGVTPEELSGASNAMYQLHKMYEKMRGSTTRNLTLAQIDDITSELEQAITELENQKTRLAIGDEEMSALEQQGSESEQTVEAITEQPAAEAEAPVGAAPTAPAMEPAPTAEAAPEAPQKPKAKVNVFTDEDVVESFSQEQYDKYERFLFEGKEDLANEMVRAQRRNLVGKEVELLDVGQISEKVRQSFAAAGIDVELLSADEFVQKLKEAGESASRTQEGVFDDSQGKIFVNKDALGPGWGTTVVWHEAIHPIMNIIHNSNKPLYDKIHRGILANAKANPKGQMADVVNWVESRYNRPGDTDATRKDEIIVETLARLASGRMSFSELQPTLRQQFIDLINRIGRILGLSTAEVSDMKAIKDLAKKISSTIKEGKDLSNIVGKENVKKFQRPTEAPQARANEVFDGILQQIGISLGVVNPKTGTSKVTNFDIAKAMNTYYKKMFKPIQVGNFGPKALDIVSEYAADEIIFGIQKFGNGSGRGWYTIDYSKALNTLATIDPDIANNPEIKEIATVVIAIASNSTDVYTNLKRVLYAVDVYKKTGKIPTDVGVGKGMSAIAKSVSVYNNLLDLFGSVNDLKEFMQTVRPVSDSKKALIEKAGVKSWAKVKDAAYGTDPEWNDTETLPTSVILFGPKIGAFYSNLSGLGGTPTIDRWCIRTMYRYMGDMKGKVLPKEIESFVQANNLQGQSKGSVMATIESHAKMFNAILTGKGKFEGISKQERNEKLKPYRKGSQIWGKLTGVVNEIEDGLTEKITNKAEYARNFRSFTKKAFERVQEKIKEKIGEDLEISDIQAILWIYEKELFGALGVKQKPESTYSASATRLINEVKSGKFSVEQLKAGELSEEDVVEEDELIDEDGAMGDSYGIDVNAYENGIAAQPDRLNENVKKLQPSLGGREKEGTFEPGKENEKEQRIQSERAGDGGGRNISGAEAPLAGAPTVQGATGPDPRLVDVARRYALKAGIPYRRQSEYVQVDPERGARIADAYDKMKHDPQDPKVKEAYADLIRQTKDQYQALVDDGYEFSFFDSETDPYGGNPNNAMRDLRANKRMAVYGTYDGYGTEGITGAAIDDNPMLEPTGLKWPDQNGVMRDVTANDLFRAVHDAFGHGLEGSGFRARGEENAWQAHIRLFTGPAVAAITSETRGQNSWLNYGPFGETNRSAKLEGTVFAEQKTGIMPEWTWTEGRASDMEEGGGTQASLGGRSTAEMDEIVSKAKADGTYLKAPNGKPSNLSEFQWAQVRTKNFKNWFGDWESSPQNASKVVDANGEPMVVYHGSKSIFDIFKTKPDKGTGEFGAHFGTLSAARSRLRTKKIYGNDRVFIAVYLNIRNPVISNDKLIFSTGQLLDILFESKKIKINDLVNNKYFKEYKENNKNDSEGVVLWNYLLDSIKDKYPNRNKDYKILESMYEELDSKILEIWDKSKYDGVEYINSVEDAGSKSYMVLEPNQIKSATGNVGAFSKEDARIQFSLGGRAEQAFSSIDKALDMPPVKSKAARAALVDEYGKEAVDQMIEITRNFTKIIDGLEEKGVVKKDCP
jgi:hypothetical protein